MLIIEGKVSEQKLLESFTAIFQEYVNAVSGDAKATMFLQARKVELYEMRLVQATAIVQYLAVQHDEELCYTLLEIGAADKPYPESIEEMERWWRVVSGRLKRWKLELETEQRNIVFTAKQNKTSEVDQQEEFQTLIVLIEKHLKYPIDEEKVSVGKLIAMLKDYHQHIKILKNQNKKYV